MFNMPARHQIVAPAAGGEYNFNSRTDIGIANKDCYSSCSPFLVTEILLKLSFTKEPQFQQNIV